MKNFTDLNLGFTNAENYRRRANKELLTKYFVRDEYLEKLLDPNVYFLVGEKGTGKTAYSTYLRNNRYKDKHAFAYDVRQTEYQKFLELKKSGHLPLSQYSEVWRTLLLILAATSVLEKSDTPEFLVRFTKLAALKRAIDDFYENAFAPEIVKILNFVEASEKSTSLMAKYSGLGGSAVDKQSNEVRDSTTVFQTNLLQIRRSFEEAIDSLRLDTDHVIFIDGIDVRPAEINYDDYFECVRGLIDAVWSLNNDFLADIKDSKGRIRVVLLVRPDIFLRTGLHNVNTKIRDNSVFLNWSSSDKDFKTSSLFRVADRLLSAQQDENLPDGQAWNHYFPFHFERITAIDASNPADINSFLGFLRFSYNRPRDINAMIGTIKDILVKRGGSPSVSARDFNDPSFRDAHADYLLGEIRDQMLFYYSQEEFDLFLEFFVHLNGKRQFSYRVFSTAVTNFVSECRSSGKAVPKFFETADTFLQFLYDQNVICYIEESEDGASSEKFFRWCFRERTPSNLAPKVRPNVTYEIFSGLSKALNIGRPIKTKEQSRKREIGTVVNISFEDGFGFIRGGPDQAEYYFKEDQWQSDTNPQLGDKVSFAPTVKYGKLRALIIRRA